MGTAVDQKVAARFSRSMVPRGGGNSMDCKSSFSLSLLLLLLLLTGVSGVELIVALAGSNEEVLTVELGKKALVPEISRARKATSRALVQNFIVINLFCPEQ